MDTQYSTQSAGPGARRAGFRCETATSLKKALADQLSGSRQDREISRQNSALCMHRCIHSFTIALIACIHSLMLRIHAGKDGCFLPLSRHFGQNQRTQKVMSRIAPRTADLKPARSCRQRLPPAENCRQTSYREAQHLESEPTARGRNEVPASQASSLTPARCSDLWHICPRNKQVRSKKQSGASPIRSLRLSSQFVDYAVPKRAGFPLLRLPRTLKPSERPLLPLILRMTLSMCSVLSCKHDGFSVEG